MFELFFLMCIGLSDTCQPSSVKGHFSSLRHQRFEVDILRQVLFSRKQVGRREKTQCTTVFFTYVAYLLPLYRQDYHRPKISYVPPLMSFIKPVHISLIPFQSYFPAVWVQLRYPRREIFSVVKENNDVITQHIQEYFICLTKYCIAFLRAPLSL